MGIKNLELRVSSVLLKSTAIEVDYTIFLETDSFSGEVAGGHSNVDSPEVTKIAESLWSEVQKSLQDGLGLDSQEDQEVDLLEDDDLEDPL